MKLNTLYYAVLVGMSASAPVLAHAHTDHHSETESSTLPIVTVQSKEQDTFSRELDAEYFSRTQAKDLHDMFKLEPSVQVGTGSRNGQKIILRGVEDLLLNVQIDGARQGANLFHHQGRVQIDPYLLKRARVITGPAPADAGSGALGGSVQFETVDAQDLLAPGQTIGARIGAHYESASNLRGGLVSAYGQLGDQGGLLAYARRNSNDEMRVGGGNKQPSTDGSYENYLVKASFLDVDGHSLRVSAQRTENIGGPLRANAPWETNNPVQSADDQLIYEQRQTLGYRYQSPHNAHLDLEFDLYQSDNGLDIHSGPFESLSQTLSHGYRLQNTSRFATADLSHALTYGLDYFYDKNQYQPKSGSRLSEYGYNHGLYLQNRMRYQDVMVSTGIRHDQFKASYNDQYDNTGSAWSPNLTVERDVLTGNHQLTLFAGYGESVNGARLNQALWLSKYPSDSADFTLGNNGKLKPEKAKLYEFGSRWGNLNVFMPGDHIGLDLTFYHTLIENYLITAGEGPGAQAKSIINADGDIISEGYEIRAHWGVDRFLLDMAYSHNKLRGYDGLPADTSGDSARVGATTGDKLVLDAQWQQRANLSLGYTLTGVQRLKDVPQGRPEKPGYVTHDLQVQWQPAIAKNTVHLTAALENVLDTRYADHTTVRDYSNAKEVASWQAGRNIRLGVDWFF